MVKKTTDQELKQRVNERMAELLISNEKLLSEIAELKKSEKVLSNTKQTLEHLLSTSAAIIYRCDPFGDYPATFVTDNIREILGYEPDEFIKKPSFWSDRIHPDDAPRIFAELPNLFENSNHIHEYRFLHKNGSYRWMLDHLKLIKDAEGNHQDIIGSFIDITERKQIEEALRESEKRFRDLAEIIPHGIQEIDEKGIIIFSNPAHNKIHGYSVGELVGKSILDLAATEKDKEEMKEYLEYLVNEKPAPTPWTGIDQTKDGRLIDVQVDWDYKFDNEGNVIGFISVITDITEQERTKEALEKEKRNLEETNIALKVLLRETDITKEELEKNMIVNIKNLLLPYVVELESRLSADEKLYTDIIKSNINEITSSFSRKLISIYSELTPREIQVADFIRQGRTNKEIARLLNITPSAVDFHRRNLRTKFNIKGKKTNLRSYLLSYVG